MTKPFRAVLAIVILLVVTAAFAKPDKATPLVFARGKKSVTVTGALAKPASKVFFTLATKKGEKYEVKASGQGTTVVMVRFADGTEDGGPGGIETEVPKTGVSRIEVHGNERGRAWKGKFTLTVKKL